MSQNLGEEYWLALAHAPCLSGRRFVRLINYFGSPRNVFEAGWWEWQGLAGDLRCYLQHPNWYAVEKDMQWLAQPGHHLLTLLHPGYPRLLREIYDPPPLLFVQGNCAVLSGLKKLAIVGTRHSSLEGEDIAQTFAESLSYLGFTITGGMTLGIEGASHWGALAGTGKTIAVAVRGLDEVYPTQHYTLAHKIAESGALISEFPPGTQVKPKHFPSRCRIISGLSLGTLVIEAPKPSTSILTVRFAIEQGREVFAIPGSIHNPLVKGCHHLIKEGAKLVETVDDILEELQIYL